MVRLKWHGTAAIELECDGGRILFDPFIPLKGSVFDIKPESFDGFSDIIVTHGHLDHIASIPAIRRRNPSVRIHCTDVPYRTLVRKGVPVENLVKVEYGRPFQVNGFSITPYHGKHAVLPKASLRRLSSILFSRHVGNVPWIACQHLACPEGDETVFYQIRCEGKSITLMGSMNLRPDVDYPTGSDVLVLPYNGWEDNYPPAVEVIERLQPQKIYLDHYDDTFPPITSPIDLSPILDRYGDKIEPLNYADAILIS